MLAKKHRLPAKVNTKHFLTFPGNLFNLKVGENKTTEKRFGFIVAKNIDKRATVRNRLKRQFRRFIEENYRKIKPGRDFLFKIKTASKNHRTKEIHDNIRDVLKKEGLIE